MDTPLLIYSISLLLTGAAAGIASIFIYRLNSEKIPGWDKIPRNRQIGIILTIIDLIWCIPHTEPLLPESCHVYFWPTIFVIAWLAYCYLDYLLSRALGGFLILLAHYFLHDSFTYHTFLSSFFAGLCYVFGIAGLFFSGKPYLLRDLFRKCAKEHSLKIITFSYLAVLSLFCTLAGILHFFKVPIL